MYLPPSMTFLSSQINGIKDNKFLIAAILSEVIFDHNYYYKHNQDLHKYFNPDDINGLWSHYLKNGWFEDRFPFEVVVDEIFYLNNYPDVSSFDGTLNQHFVIHGYKEGRLPYMFNLNIKKYNKRLKVLEPDSEKIVTESQMYKHFLTKGYHQLYA
jgi:hypothetical protein